MVNCLMSKIKSETAGNDIFPQALIIEGGKFGKHLADTLENRSCQTNFIENADQRPDKFKNKSFDYIIFFASSFPDNIAGFKKQLTRQGKFILVAGDIGHDHLTELKKSVKIFEAGDLDNWQEGELSEAILEALFSIRQTGLWDKKRLSQISTVSTAVTSKPVNLPKPDEAKMPSARHQPIARAEELKVERQLVSRKWLALLIILVIFFFGLSFSVYWFVFSSQNIIRDFRAHLSSANFEALTMDLDRAKRNTALLRQTYDFFYSVFFPLRGSTSFQNTGEVITVTTDIINSFEDTLIFANRFSLLPGSSFQVKKELTVSDMRESQNKIEDLLDTLLLSREKIEKISFALLPKESFISYLDLSIEKLTSIRQLLPIIEKIFIPAQTKVYLLLFQNNMELRPTGGFIGSYAILSVLQGKVLDFSIHDVYTADGQLKGHVEPPYAIRKYLEQPNWFLRDSNFDPDFSASAIQAAWFLQKEMGTSVDGVIGINLFFVQSLLKILGPLSLTDFNQELITSENFFFKAHLYTQKNFFPGSSYKKDFLTSVSSELQERILRGKNVPWFEVLHALKTALDEKNLLLYSVAPEIQEEVERAGWGGRLVDVKCISNAPEKNDLALLLLKTCYPDYLSVVEANLGVNKVNYFIDKSVLVDKRFIGDGLISTTLTLNYENKSIPEIYSGGFYKNYLRLIVPQGSRLLSLTLNGVPIPVTETSIEKYGFDKTVFGFLVTIAPGNQAVVKTTYTLPRNFTYNANSYQFFWQKQAGDKTSPLILTINTSGSRFLNPVNFKPTSKKDQEILYTTDTQVDRIFVLEAEKE